MRSTVALVVVACALPSCGRFGFDARSDVRDDGSVAVDAPFQVRTCAPDSALVGCWRLDDTDPGRRVIDSSPNHLDGACTNQTCPLAVAGVDGGALQFDGVSQLVRVPHAAVLDAMPAITVTAWVWSVASPNTYRFIVTKPVGTSVFNTFELLLENGDLACYISRSDAVQGRVSIPWVGDSRWVHVAATAAPPRLELYVDGALSASVQNAGPFGLDSADIFIGADLDNAADLLGYWHGMIDEVRLYRRALSPSEIAALAVSPSP